MRKAWGELQRPQGQLRCTQDCYLKLWHLSRPTLRCDYVLFDEAQDADPVIAAVIVAQHHAQRVYVGDSCQAIYGWRGAIDAMSTVRRITPCTERAVALRDVPPGGLGA